MMKDVIQKLTLNQPATYRIKMPGHLDQMGLSLSKDKTKN
jgi:hypothetical protein